MGVLTDAAYLAAVAAASPLLLPRMIRRGHFRADWEARLGHGDPLPPPHGPRILLHGVSVGEINACRVLVGLLERHPASPEVVVAATTATGLRRACELFADRHAVVQYPLDLSGSVRRLLERLRPDAVGMVELEVWPNLTEQCRQRGIPMAVVNGRLSERSFRGYRRVRPLVSPMFRRLDRVAAQTPGYAARFEFLGVPADRVEVSGSMKWDAAALGEGSPGAAALAEAMGIDPAKPLVVAGSTAPGEPELIAGSLPSGVQLLVAPRRPEWAEDAMRALPGAARRSRGERGSATGRFLLDTIGELRDAYALADLVVVGRSFGGLFGSDMLEPIAMGKAVVVGPAVGDFAEIAAALLEGGGLVQCSREALPATLARLLGDPAERAALASRGGAVIRGRRGASQRHADLLVELAIAGRERR
jgi:3-deoxy-D-manno-octulosonic-acid transferase